MRKLYRLPKEEKYLLLEAIGLLFMAKLMLLLLPFRYCLTTVKKETLNREPELKTLKQIRNAIRRANKLAIWENVCLVQSFAARWMLQKRNIKSSLIIGVKHNTQKKLIAHSWLTVQDYEIIARGDDYIAIASH